MCPHQLLQEINQRGELSSLPDTIKGWDLEAAIDMQMISAMCPSCRILLVVADSSFLVDLGTAVNSAVDKGELIS